MSSIKHSTMHFATRPTPDDEEELPGQIETGEMSNSESGIAFTPASLLSSRSDLVCLKFLPHFILNKHGV